MDKALEESQLWKDFMQLLDPNAKTGGAGGGDDDELEVMQTEQVRANSYVCMYV